MAGAASLSHGILGSAAIVGGLRLTRCYDHARIEVSLLATHVCTSGSGTSCSSGSGTSSNGSRVGSEQQHQHVQSTSTSSRRIKC